MTTEKWNGKTPNWELEPVAGEEQKEAQEVGAEVLPSVAEARIAELAAETKEIVSESPEKKAAEVEAVRAEIAAMANPEQRMATPLSQQAEEESAANRTKYEKQFEDQAKIRNESRSRLQKVFGRGKVTAMGLAQEEALRINKLVDRKNELNGGEASTKSFSEDIARSGEFGIKDAATIKAEEFLKSKSPDIAKNIQSGDIDSARAILEKLLEKVSNDERRSLEKGFEEIVTNHVDTLVQSKDFEGMKKLVQENRVDEIGAKNIAMMPQEVSQSPLVQAQLVKGIEETFSGNREYGLRKANEYVALGLMTKESAQKLLASESFQNKLVGDIEDTFSGNREFGLRKANEYVALGLITQQKANQVFANL